MEPTNSQPDDPPAEKNVSFVKDVQLMMFGLGDISEPLRETAELVEHIVLKQMISIIHQSLSIAHMRGQELIGPEDILFLMRKDMEGLKRLLDYLGIKDERQMLNKTIRVMTEPEEVLDVVVAATSTTDANKVSAASTTSVAPVESAVTDTVTSTVPSTEPAPEPETPMAEPAAKQAEEANGEGAVAGTETEKEKEKEKEKDKDKDKEKAAEDGDKAGEGGGGGSNEAEAAQSEPRPAQVPTETIHGFPPDATILMMLTEGCVPITWDKSRRLFCLDFLRSIGIDEIDIETADDSIKLERQMRANKTSLQLSPTAYESFHAARRASFGASQLTPKRFESWLKTKGNVIYELKPPVIEILVYLAKETVAQLIDRVFVLRDEKLDRDNQMLEPPAISVDEILEVIRRSWMPTSIPMSVFTCDVPNIVETRLIAI